MESLLLAIGRVRGPVRRYFFSLGANVLQDAQGVQHTQCVWACVRELAANEGSAGRLGYPIQCLRLSLQTWPTKHGRLVPINCGTPPMMTYSGFVDFNIHAFLQQGDCARKAAHAAAYNPNTEPVCHGV